MLLPLLVVHGDCPELAVVAYANESYEKTFGLLEPGSSLQGLFAQFPLHPLVLALRGGDVDAQRMLLPASDGVFREFQCSATALHRDGRTTGAVFCTCDVTESMRLERSLSVQSKVARIAMEAEDFQSAARRILESIVCDLGWALGTLWIVEESGLCLTRAAQWPSSTLEGIDPDWSGKDQMAPGEGLPGQVWESGQAQWVKDLSCNPGFPRSHEAGRAGLRAACSFPILLDGKVLGIFEFFHHQALARDNELLETLLVVGTHVGQLVRRRSHESAIEQAHARAEKAYQREHEIAARFQNSLWPRAPFLLSGYCAAFRYRPVFAEADVGGDFFNLFDLSPEKVAVVIGDVGGKGLEAAVVAAWIQHALVALALRAEATPCDILDHAQLLVAGLNVECMVTVFVAFLEKATGRLAYSSAGHEPALVWRTATQTCERLACGQLALVGLPVEPYVCHEACIQRGDLLLLHTDGLSEAGSPEDGMLGQDGVVSLLEGWHDQEPGEILRLMCQAATRRSRGHLKDDLAMIAIRRLLDDDILPCLPVAMCHCDADE